MRIYHTGEVDVMVMKNAPPLNNTCAHIGITYNVLYDQCRLAEILKFLGQR